MAHRRKRQVTLLAVSSILLFSAAAGIAIRTAQNDLASEYNHAITVLTHEYRAVVSGHSVTVRLMLELLINQEWFTTTVESAYDRHADTDSDGVGRYRRELRTALAPVYDRLDTLRFRRLHVHFADNISFLRMYETERYGDDLSSISTTVARANRDRRFVMGFEEDESFNGYRYVEPIHTPQGRHVGSVELRIGFDTIMDDLNRLFGKEYHLALRTEPVRSGTAPELQDSERESLRSLDYRIKSSTTVDSKLRRILFSNDQYRSWEHFRSHLDRDVPFAMRISRSGSHYVLAGIPIRNVQGQVAGHFLALEPNYRIGATFRNTGFMILLFLLGATGTIFTGIVLIERGIALEKLAARDQLTELYNRRLFIELFDHARRQQARTGETMVLLLIDLDYFKEVNDRFGHNTGDHVLRSVARRLETNVRAGDVVARWGGEEFIVLLRDIPPMNTRPMAEKICTILGDREIAPVGRVTASIGAVTVPPGAENLEHFVAQADERLYQAKTAGRSRAVCG